MSTTRARRKVVSEEKRERDVFLLYGAAFRDIPSLDDFEYKSGKYNVPSHHVGRPSADSALTALAQLATFRLKVGRAMISLIDHQRQYILAEATPTTCLKGNTVGDAASSLWLGNVSIPRSRGICEKVLDLDLHPIQTQSLSTVVIEDLHQEADEIIKDEGIRFYAGTPLTSPAGAIVGSLCILDEAPRPEGLCQEDLESLRDIAHSVMGYLHNYTIKEQYRRGEQFTRGLVSFSEGASSILPFQNTSEDPAQMNSACGLQTDSVKGDNLNHAEDELPEQRPVFSQEDHAPKLRPKANRQRSIRKLQEDILPLNSRSMFARAANVMMASSDLDGVLILDASVATNKKRRWKGSDASSETSTTDSENSRQSSDYMESRPRRRSSALACQVLGCATPDTAQSNIATEARYHSFPETDLVCLLEDFPLGKIITYDEEGIALSSTDESHTSDDVTGSSATSTSKRKAGPGRTKRYPQALQAMLPEARSIAFLPFWDYERSRWFAGCLCWSNSTRRLLSASSDLAYFRVFSHSIMRELSRLDALALNQAKSTFVASISHELRSPLHGILGTLEFLKDTSLDSFQTSMFNSLSACSRTLLDTINQIMVHAKVSERRKNVSSRMIKNENTIRLSSKPLKNHKTQAGAFDLGITTEEVVETVFSGSTYVPMTSSIADEPSSPSTSESDQQPKRKNCYIVLDLALEEDLAYCFPIGSWRRIVMNIFGNAIKYTESGHIQVSLRTNEATKIVGASTTVTLTITDSGSGMSSQFLANKTFEPFAQENPFSVGTGLGLSIVKQIIEMDGGKIEISSEPSVGTQLTVKLGLTRPEKSLAVSLQRSEYLNILPRMEGRRVCILSRDDATLFQQLEDVSIAQGLISFTNSLANTLEKHLKMHVVRTAEWTGHESELVIVPELSCYYLAAIRSGRSRHAKAPVTIFIAMDALEAATLRSDARVQRKESVVEIMTQPCGPYKLAYVLNKCLDRFALSQENLQYQSSGIQSPNTELNDDGPSRQTDLTLNFPSASEKIANESIPASSPYNALAASVHPLTDTTFGTAPPLLPSRVFIVDDNAINRRLLVSFLKKQDYIYEEAQNGLEALEAYRQHPQRFGIVLMDLSMPVMDGMTSTRAIRQYEEANGIPPCRIIALTGLTSASARLEALNSGVDEFLTKPVNFKALGQLMKNGGRRRRSKAIVPAIAREQGVKDT